MLTADEQVRQAALAKPSGGPILDELRHSTRDIHERLHLHTGFAALQDGTIDRASYRALLSRLYGFYHPFEVAAETAPTRTCWLKSDLSALSMTKDQIANLPRCIAMPALANSEQVTGALYVVEGSSLGGRALAPCVDRLLGAGVIGGRRFFTGYGSETGARWRGFLADLALLPPDPITRGRCLAAAIETFEAFELWLSGWEGLKQ